ncbi:hypothetical protein SAMN05880582_102243 [Rhizobium sp. RU20A]|uniref:DUF2256 domain-containing protein n=1 Tax=Rhizobium sp. RU20A TaxID=1907412 RepID=UPI00095638F4|nr:DUF2256 domain-containing protein [Rhizobium sp. RU20A]SIQ59588.1 hypothetical protein SAMN05880582_102243 [Rhizobium sp. RU20A]
MPRGVAKQNLPEKICPTCGRPFSWRRKWARNWETVLYCSERCRREKSATVSPMHAQGTGTGRAGR